MLGDSTKRTAKLKTNLNSNPCNSSLNLPRSKGGSGTTTPNRKLRLRHEEALWRKGIRAVVPCNVRRGLRPKFFSYLNKLFRRNGSPAAPVTSSRSLSTSTSRASKLSAEACALGEICDRAFSNEEFATSILWIPESLTQFRDINVCHRSEISQNNRSRNTTTRVMRQSQNVRTHVDGKGQETVPFSDSWDPSARNLSVRSSADLFRTKSKSKGGSTAPIGHFGQRSDTSPEQRANLRQTQARSFPRIDAQSSRTTETFHDTAHRHDGAYRKLLGPTHAATVVPYTETRPDGYMYERCLLSKSKLGGSPTLSLSTSFSSSYIVVEAAPEPCQKADFPDACRLKNMQYPIIPKRISSMQPYNTESFQREGTVRGQVPFRLRQTTAIKASPHRSLYGELASAMGEDGKRRQPSTTFQDGGRQQQSPRPPPPSPSMSSLHPPSSYQDFMLESPQFRQSLSYSKIAVMYDVAQKRSEDASTHSLQRKFDAEGESDAPRPCTPNFSRGEKALPLRNRKVMTSGTNEVDHHHEVVGVSQKIVPILEGGEGSEMTDNLPHATSHSRPQLPKNRRHALLMETQEHITSGSRMSNRSFDLKSDSPTLPEEQGLTRASSTPARVVSAHQPPQANAWHLPAPQPEE